MSTLVGSNDNSDRDITRQPLDSEPKENTTPAVEELLEAIRLTQEYAQFPCLPGWDWWDAYIKHRPNDAARLYHEWRMAERSVSTQPTVVEATPGEHVEMTAQRAERDGYDYYVHNDRVMPAGRNTDYRLSNREMVELLLTLGGQ